MSSYGKMKKLPKSLQSKTFTYSEACESGLTKYAIAKLIESGELERIERGLYRAVGEDLSDEELYRRAIKKVGEPAAVCLLSALSHYELTDIIAKQVWLMVPAEKRIKSSNIKLYRARDLKWRVGIDSHRGYKMTSLERTIIDSLTLKTIISPRVGLDALKRAIANKKTDVSKIIKVANALGVSHRIMPYLEALT